MGNVSKIDKNGDPIETSNQVENIVNTLRTSGNNLVYGIIDWDRKNNGNDSIKVLGKNKGYAIENFILNPISLAIFLLREKFITIEELNLENKKYFDIKDFDENALQVLSDKITEQLFHEDLDDMIEFNFLNNKKINIPEKYMYIQGHELEVIIKEQFPELKRYRKDNQLKTEIINKVFEDFNDVIPLVFNDMFKEIQGN